MYCTQNVFKYIFKTQAKFWKTSLGDSLRVLQIKGILDTDSDLVRNPKKECLNINKFIGNHLPNYCTFVCIGRCCRKNVDFLFVRSFPLLDNTRCLLFGCQRLIDVVVPTLTPMWPKCESLRMVLLAVAMNKGALLFSQFV